MSKKKSNNSAKHNKNKKTNIVKNNSINKQEELDVKNNVIKDEKEIKKNNIGTFDSSDRVFNNDDLFIEINHSDDTIYDEGIEDEVNIDKKDARNHKKEKQILEEKEEIKEDKDKEEKNNEYNLKGMDYISEGDIEVEKQASSTALRVPEKKSFFLLIFKFLGVCIKNFFSSIYGVIYTCYLKINNFFEDRAEDLDRRIREIQDEQVIKNKKRELDYERYNSKRIYEDLERAEKYRSRASNRVNTEKYFEDRINEEKVNNTILVRKAEEEAKEAKESKEKERSINQFNESKRRSRIEKKKNEILELRRRRKEKERLLKEEEKKQRAEKEAKEKDLQKRKEASRVNKEEKVEDKKNLETNKKQDFKKIETTSQKILDNNKNDVAFVEQNNSNNVNDEKNVVNEDSNNIYDDLFKEFGNEEYFDEDDIETSDLPNVDDIVKKADKGEKIQNVNYKEKNKDRIVEPYEKFEKENDVREIDDKLKSEILRLIDVPESETKDDFISEIDIPASFRKDEITEENDKLNKENTHKSYVDELMEGHSNATTIGDLLGDNEVVNENEIKNTDSKIELSSNKESDPTVNIFAALRDANKKNKEKEKEKTENNKFNLENNENKNDKYNKDNFTNVNYNSDYIQNDFPNNSKVRVSKNQDGFKNLKLKNNNRKDDYYYDEENLNVGTWERKEDSDVNKKNIDYNNQKINTEVNPIEDHLKYKNPYEAYGKYIKNPEPEKKIETRNKINKYSNKNDIQIRVNDELINKTKTRNNQNLNSNNLDKNIDRNTNLKENDINNQDDKMNIRDVKDKFVNLFKSQKDKDKKTSNDFDEDLYTNKFIKNIIGVEDSQNSEENRKRAEIRRESREKRENRNNDMQNNKPALNDNLPKSELTESEEKEKYIREYLNDTSYLDGNLKLDKDSDRNELQDNHSREIEDPKVKILNVEEINKDEIVVNAYVDSDEMIYNPDEDYSFDYKESDRNGSNNHKGEHHFNLKDSTRKKVEERRERKISKNEEIQRKANDNYYDDNMSFGDMIKDMMSGINSSLSEIPENWKKKRESRNRIKRNQIYSTSHNRRRGRR